MTEYLTDDDRKELLNGYPSGTESERDRIARVAEAIAARVAAETRGSVLREAAQPARIVRWAEGVDPTLTVASVSRHLVDLIDGEDAEPVGTVAERPTPAAEHFRASSKTPEQIAHGVIQANYGPGTDWDEPNRFGERGFTRAQAESDIDADEIAGLIGEGIDAYRAQLATALRGADAVRGVRPFPRASLSALIDAYAEWDGEVDTFCLAWDNYVAGLDFPCSEIPHGVHSTYLTDDGSCDFCGDKNRG